MIIENKLTSYLFTDIGPTSPTTWDLSGFIPEGIGLLENLQYRHRVPNQFLSPWYGVSAFNRTTRVATATVPDEALLVEFRRQTPRYELIRDPLDKASRVAQPDLQLNADQGMFVAIEWAAEYGIDAHSQLVSGNPPLSVGETMHTQLHYGPEADYRQKVWNFRFAGGYREPEDVRVQIKVNGVWEVITVDYAEYDHLNPSAAPYKLIDPFQLYLDFGPLADTIEGMVIYRRTPREFPVPTPSHRSQITAEGMTPTATQAFFVAVELGEEMNRNVPECECLAVYTSEPYGVVLNPDSFGVTGPLATNAGFLMLQPFVLDDMRVTQQVVGGNLREVVQKYLNAPRDAIQVTMGVVSGVLFVVLKPYSHYVPEKFTMGSSVVAGALVVVVIKYENYVAEKFSVGRTVLSGTLT